MPQNVPQPPKISNAGQQQHFRSPNPQMPYQQPEPMMNPVPGMPQPPVSMPPAGTSKSRTWLQWMYEFILTRLECLADLQQQQRALLMQVLQLSDADIAALPPSQQEQVRQLVSSIESVNHDSLIPILTFCSHCY